MTRFFSTLAFFLLPVLSAVPLAVGAQTHSQSHGQTQVSRGADTKSQATLSPYAGLENREIKSLSEEDLVELRAGGGWGLALAAELNGVPGPAHLLELRTQIDLTPEQFADIEVIYAQMKAQAIETSERFIAAEAAIEAGFREGNLSTDRLQELVAQSAAVRAELRYVHLLRHLETPPLLSVQQIARYNSLRGYDTNSDPCAFVPDGHDPQMWRRHNNCTN